MWSARCRFAFFFTWALAGLFWCHRGLSLEFLADPELSTAKLGEAVLVGAASDFWIAFLWIFAAALVDSLWSKFHRRTVPSVGPYLSFFAIASVLTALHEPYIEFFHHQLLPLHVVYVFDLAFLKAQAASSLQSVNLLILVGASLVMGFSGLAASWLIKLSSGFSIALYSALLVLSLTAHNRNIFWRVQWFVPPELAQHYWEHFYSHLRDDPLPKNLSKAEIDALANAFRLPHDLDQDELIRRVVWLDLDDARPSPEALALKESFTRKQGSASPPITLVILMESLRPSEMAAYYPGVPSLTPNLDRFAARSLRFAHAYSTGTVTRGGQEAVWCGHLSSANQSLMRAIRPEPVPCLPETLQGTASFWWHGGNPEFDGQGEFWRKRGVSHRLSFADFGMDQAETEWGKSDLVLYDRALKELPGLMAQGKPLLGMILTLSNHIPWVVPTDAPLMMQIEADILEEPNFGSTAYADFAFGRFVDSLQASDIWSRLLLIVVSDHGVAGPGYHTQKTIKDRKAKSHIVLLVGGGIAEDAGLGGKTWDPWVSQADIAPLIAWLHGVDKERFMGDLLLTQHRARPVVSDLGGQLYLPELDTELERSVQSKPPDPKLAPEAALGLSYYRSFLLTKVHQALR